MNDKKTRGRPKSSNPRNKAFLIRLTEEDAANLEFYSMIGKMTKTQLLKEAMNIEFSWIKSRHSDD